MNVWTVILAGILIASLPNLLNGALEDGGFYMLKNYTKFERRVWPANTSMLCTDTYTRHEWFRFNIFEQMLQNVAKGNNSMNATFTLGTPLWFGAPKAAVEFAFPLYCKYLPKAYRNVSGPPTSTVGSLSWKFPFEYYAVRVNDTERATIKKGWNYLLNLVKNRFPENPATNYQELIVEKTAAGIIYVGAFQHPPE